MAKLVSTISEAEPAANGSVPRFQAQRIQEGAVHSELTSSRSEPEPSPPAKRPFRWWLLIPLALAACLFVAARSMVQSGYGQDSLAIGKPAPQLDLVLLSDELSLEPLQSAAGEVTLLHLWGTWCGPCRMEYPHLAVVASRLQSEPGFRFVAVTCENSRDETFEGLWAKTLEFFDSSGVMDTTVFADPSRVTRRSVKERLEQPVLYYPTSILIDAEGSIAGVWQGYTPAAVDEIEVVARRLLASRPAR